MVKEEHGVLLWKGSEEGGLMWLVFPSYKHELIGALLTDIPGPFLKHGWIRCAIDPEQMKNLAQEALDGTDWETYPIVLASLGKQTVLYINLQTDDEKIWSLVGQIEYGNPPNGKLTPVRWINISEPPYEFADTLHKYVPGSPPIGTRNECMLVLQEVSQWQGSIREVTCLLTLDPQKKVYCVRLFDGRKSIARKESELSDEIIRFLKYPHLTGEYFQLVNDTFLKWDPSRDVQYDEVTIKQDDGSKQRYNLSIFKPYIHRSKFFPESYSIPTSCEEFLQTKIAEEIKMRIEVDERYKAAGEKKYLKVHFEGLEEERQFTNLEYEIMGIFDVALLAEAGQLVDMKANARHDFSLNAASLVDLGVAYLLTDYPRIHDWLVGYIEELESDEFVEEDEEDIPEEGPELRFEDVNIEESFKRRMLEVEVRFINTDDSDDFTDLIVFSISSEIAKTQTISYEHLVQQVKQNLRGYRVSSDVRADLLTEIGLVLEAAGVKIEYY